MNIAEEIIAYGIVVRSKIAELEREVERQRGIIDTLSRQLEELNKGNN